MELTTDEKKELSQLSGYFKKLEITSNHDGVELDDYISLNTATMAMPGL